jgi:ElaB/YqjD/DUF883 family membrane-anchored ribosome-binding protein
MAKDQVMQNDALDHVRTAAQELHQAISETLAKGTTATKAQVESVIKKAKDAAESAKSVMNARHELAQAAIKQQLAQAIDKLDSAQKHAGDSLKSSGEAFQASLSKALADARVAVQNTSEAIAARRSEQAVKQAPVKRAS